jgi:alkylresorcinol/alkylpyrone synthase
MDRKMKRHIEQARIAGVASAFPEHYYSQKEVAGMLKRVWSDAPDKILDRLESFHANTQIEGRYLALPVEAYEDLSGFKENNDVWIRSALQIGEQVLCGLLDQAELSPEAVHQLLFTTITGLAVPSVDALLMNRIPFSRHMKRTPVFGWGCMGGAAGLARTADYLEGHPTEAAILLSIELCSLTLQRDDLSVANLVSSGLFGDGAPATRPPTTACRAGRRPTLP